MDIDITKDKITVPAEYFDAKATLECGQVFRYKPCGDGYEVISGGKKCLIRTDAAGTVITTDDTDYFYRYFDLSFDYAALTQRLWAFTELREGLTARRGIHILRQDLFETIISFIISQNNNIKRIQGIIESICLRFGTRKDGYYAFPTPQQLSWVNGADFRALGAGYRDVYLYKTAQALKDGTFLEELKTKPYEKAFKMLCTLDGVGPKVADCISLFALRHTCCYPVDTWVLKADGKPGDTAAAVRQRGMERYGEYAGFAQQYRFYNEREK